MVLDSADLHRNWLAVASAEHVRIGRAEGFMQVNHGKAAPLRRIRPGEAVVYYSPSLRLGAADRLRSFTAIGVVEPKPPYQGEMGEGFRPFRRDVTWFDAREASIEPLLGSLDFCAGNRNWGYQLRFGLIAITDRDLDLIGEAMGVDMIRCRVLAAGQAGRGELAPRG